MLSRLETLRIAAFGIALVSLLVVGPATAQEPDGIDLVFDGNCLWPDIAGGSPYNTDSGGASCPSGTFDTPKLVQVYYEHNAILDPSLVDPFNLADPDFSPTADSPVLCKDPVTGMDNMPDSLGVVLVSEIDPFFDTVSYVGALDYTGGVAVDDWTKGWTYHNYDGGQGRTDIPALPHVQYTLADSITVDTVWDGSQSVYELYGRVQVTNGATLTILPGTVILGMPGTDAFLAIQRDAKVIANGTRELPIIFTSGADYTQGLQTPGDWGGIVTHGRAIANCGSGGAVPGCNSTATGQDCLSEGDEGPAGQGAWFGGSVEDDSSGSFEYCRIEYSGREIAPNNELNCWTWNAVGRETHYDYLQAFGGTDDGFEWFGGNAQVKHLVSIANQDDNLDWQMGFRGKVQYAVVLQVADFGGDKGIESDNNEFNFECPGRSNPMLSNLTLIGSDAGADGIHHRRGTAALVVNSVITHWPSNCYRVQHTETFDNCMGQNPLPMFDCGVIGVADAGAPSIPGFVIAAAPNPVFASSTFTFNLTDETDVRLSVYDATGRLVDQVFQGHLGAGNHALDWTPGSVTSGVYYYKAVAGSQQASGKLLVLD
ncbi:MAG: T9SS type A sorting domain-containing protein [Candidatus Eiseniibacteriota bacterium]|jgi:hypothetical protein